MTKSIQAVFVNKISRRTNGSNIVVEASNGSEEGPPFVRFEVAAPDIQDCFIGKRYTVTIEEG